GISRIISAYYVPPNRVIAMQPQYSPAVLIPPPDAIEEINIGVHELCQLQDAESLAYHLEGFAELSFGHRFQRKPDAPESLFNES
ncbi:hypothetical protein NL358_27995, partial [Klebsiella pneumoniae]|nr:hypothetical protein [Klebsiella pneumoniae]